MAVKVRVGSTYRTHEDGGAVAIEDGHLLVRKNVGGAHWKTIAIYAPSSWHDAEVVDGTS